MLFCFWIELLHSQRCLTCRVHAQKGVYFTQKPLPEHVSVSCSLSLLLDSSPKLSENIRKDCDLKWSLGASPYLDACDWHRWQLREMVRMREGWRFVKLINIVWGRQFLPCTHPHVGAHSHQLLQVDGRTGGDIISSFYPSLVLSFILSVCWIRVCGDNTSPRSERERWRETYSQFTWDMNGKRGRNGGGRGVWGLWSP